MITEIERSILRIKSEDNIWGSGVLVTPCKVLTCAHVVADALGLEIENTPPEGVVQVDFPLIPEKQTLISHVIGWRPDTDVALLEIVDEVPMSARYILPKQIDEMAGHDFHVCGFPQGRDYGTWSFGKILRRNAKGYIQLESETSSYVQQGFSGSLVWDATKEQMAGIVIETDRNVRETKTAYFIPIDTIINSFPGIVQNEESEPKVQDFKYSCFISFPYEAGIQGQRIREFAETLYSELNAELSGLSDKPVFMGRGNELDETELAKAICESVCMVVILTPKYFSAGMSLCAGEYKAMVNLERQRLSCLTKEIARDINLIIPVLPYSRDILPIRVIGQRIEFDFKDLARYARIGDHPEYSPRVRRIAEYIYHCQQILEACMENPCGECNGFHLPTEQEIHEIIQMASPRQFIGFPGR